MAAEELSIIVSVNIAAALSKLTDLQDELEDLSDKIDEVNRGARVSVRTDVDAIDRELTILSSKIEAWEAANSINVDTNVGSASFGGGGAGAAAARNIDFSNTTPAITRLGVGSDTFDARGSGDGGMRPMRDAMTGLRRAVRRLTDSSRTFDLRMSDMHNMMARLVPLLAVFVGAVPAAVTAMYTLAAAGVAAAASLAAIAGFGALGLALENGQFKMKNLTEAFQNVQDDFIDAFAPLAERLQPIFEDALAGLERFFDAVAAQGDSLVALTEEARAFGGFIIDFVPDALSTLSALVQTFSDEFAAIGRFIDKEFANIIRTAASITESVLPVLSELVLRLGRALPAIMKMSLGFLRVANIIVMLMGKFAQLLGMLGITPQMFGFVTATTLALASAIALARTALLSFIATMLKRLGAAVIGYITRLAGMRVATIMATIASWGLYSALVAIVGLLTGGLALLGLTTAIQKLGIGFSSTAGKIGSATDALREFDSVASGMSTNVSTNPYAWNPDDEGGGSGGSSGSGPTVINVESSGNPQADNSNLERASWLDGRTTGK